MPEYKIFRREVRLDHEYDHRCHVVPKASSPEEALEKALAEHADYWQRSMAERALVLENDSYIYEFTLDYIPPRPPKPTIVATRVV